MRILLTRIILENGGERLYLWSVTVSVTLNKAPNSGGPNDAYLSKKTGASLDISLYYILCVLNMYL